MIRRNEREGARCCTLVGLLQWTITCSLFVGASNILPQAKAQHSCSETMPREVVVRDKSSVADLQDALTDAKFCATNSTTAGKPQLVMANWHGAVTVASPISVALGVVLEISGKDGQGSSASSDANHITNSSSSSISCDDATGTSTDGDGTAIRNCAVIDGNNATRLFIVTGELHMANVSLRGGRALDSYDGGGAVYMTGEASVLSCESCVWESHFSSTVGGAVVATDYSSVVLKGRNEFKDCEALKGGGAVYLYSNSTCEVAKGGVAVFERCSSDKSGGGVMLVASAHLVVSAGASVEFRECNVGDGGGGLYARTVSSVRVEDGGSLAFSNCSSGMSKGANGGGMCTYSSSVVIGRNALFMFTNNSAPGDGDGGGIFGDSTSVTVAAGSTVSIVGNSASDGGGGVFLRWDKSDATGDIKTRNCLTLAAGTTSTFLDNVAEQYGGAAYFGLGCNVEMSGDVRFEGGIAERSGAMYGDSSNITIPGVVSFVNNTARRWGGAMMMIDTPLGGCNFTGSVVFANNTAGRSGGGVYLENAGVFFSTTGGYLSEEADSAVVVGPIFKGNEAGYDGGVIAVDGGTVRLGGGLYRGNTAFQRGGVLFATGESFVEWTGGASQGNSAAAGGALYISNSEARLTDVVMSGDRTPSGAVVFLADADVRAVNVSIVAPVEGLGLADSGAFALHVDTMSVFRGFACAFESWGKGLSTAAPVVLSEGQAFLDSCDFSRSTASMLLQTASHPATVRNAVVGSLNYKAAEYNSSERFAATAYTCATLPAESACLAAPDSPPSSSTFDGDDDDALASAAFCVDADNGMGVICSSFSTSATGDPVSLEGSPELEFTRDVSASELNNQIVFFHPDPVSQVFTLRWLSTSGGEDGEFIGGSNEDAMVLGGEVAGTVLWELRFADGTDEGAAVGEDGQFKGDTEDKFSWQAVPSSGLLAAGGEMNIRVVGTPPTDSEQLFSDQSQEISSSADVYNGKVRAAFFVVVPPAGRHSKTDVTIFEGEFYYCGKGFYWSGAGKCESCAAPMESKLDGIDVLDCSEPGFTIATLPLKPGYWRGDTSRTFIRECLLPESCAGSSGVTLISSSASPSSSSPASSSIRTTTESSSPRINQQKSTTKMFTMDDSEHHVDHDTRYCSEGYRGVYCSLCAEDYRKISGNHCMSCGGAWGLGATMLLWAAVALLPLLLLMIFVFLLGGLTAVWQLKNKIMRMCCCRSSASTTHGLPHIGFDSKDIADSRNTPSDSNDEGLGKGRDEDQNWRGGGVSNMAKSALARFIPAIPFQKIKIMVVVWQILTQFSALTDVPYPATYRRFLAAVDIFNFDIAWPVSVSCIVGDLGFYERLILSTLAPVVVLSVLMCTYLVALYRHRGSMAEDVEERQRATVRHASAALLVCFLVFSSVSTTIFSTFSCDYIEDLDVSLLRADYRLSCDNPDHIHYEVYAGFMILLYPIGIPFMFAIVLLQRKDKINPPTLDELVEARGRARGNKSRNGKPRRSPSTAINPMVSTKQRIEDIMEKERQTPSREHSARRSSSSSNNKNNNNRNSKSGGDGRGCRVSEKEKRCSNRYSTLSELKDGAGAGGHSGAEFAREQMLRRRLQDPDLQPTKFLWEPYEPHNYYYETVECGRRCLLTGALVFVMPNTAVQVAGACVFAFLSLLVFELLRPHISDTDAGLYRTGCIVIFFSNFLGLMAKADISGEKAQSQEIFGLVLILVHFGMVVSIIVQLYFGIQAVSEELDDTFEDLLRKNNTHCRCSHALLANGHSSRHCRIQSCKRSGGDADADDLDATVVWGREAATANIHRRREIEMGEGYGRGYHHKHDDSGSYLSDSADMRSMLRKGSAMRLGGIRFGRKNRNGAKVWSRSSKGSRNRRGWGSDISPTSSGFASQREHHARAAAANKELRKNADKPTSEGRSNRRSEAGLNCDGVVRASARGRSSRRCRRTLGNGDYGTPCLSRSPGGGGISSVEPPLDISSRVAADSTVSMTAAGVERANILESSQPRGRSIFATNRRPRSSSVGAKMTKERDVGSGFSSGFSSGSGLFSLAVASAADVVRLEARGEAAGDDIGGGGRVSEEEKKEALRVVVNSRRVQHQQQHQQQQQLRCQPVSSRQTHISAAAVAHARMGLRRYASASSVTSPESSPSRRAQRHVRFHRRSTSETSNGSDFMVALRAAVIASSRRTSRAAIARQVSVRPSWLLERAVAVDDSFGQSRACASGMGVGGDVDTRGWRDKESKDRFASLEGGTKTRGPSWLLERAVAVDDPFGQSRACASGMGVGGDVDTRGWRDKESKDRFASLEGGTKTRVVSVPKIVQPTRSGATAAVATAAAADVDLSHDNLSPMHLNPALTRSATDGKDRAVVPGSAAAAINVTTTSSSYDAGRTGRSRRDSSHMGHCNLLPPMRLNPALTHTATDEKERWVSLESAAAAIDVSSTLRSSDVGRTGRRWRGSSRWRVGMETIGRSKAGSTGAKKGFEVEIGDWL